MKEYSRKFIVACLLGIGAGITFAFTTRTIEFYGALLGFWGAIVALYNNANIQEHKLKNGNGG